MVVAVNSRTRRKRIEEAFSQWRESSIELDIRTCKRTSGANTNWSDIGAAIIDFETDPQQAATAAFKLRHARPDLGIAVMASSGTFMAPLEVVNLGLGPLVISDEEGIASLPQVVTAMATAEASEGSGIAEQSRLLLRHQELREITESMARQSVHLIRLRNELSAEKGKMETIINGMTDGMIFFDTEGRLEVVNPLACKLFPSLNPDLHPTMEEFIESLPEKIEMDSPDSTTMEIDLAEGAYKARYLKVSDSGGVNAGSLFLFTDITADKRYERLKTDFTNMISHELRTPLTSIRAAVDNFIRGALGEVTRKQKKFLELIVRNVDRQQHLVDDLLDLAKFEAGQMDLRLEITNVKRIAANSVEQYSLAFKDKGVELVLESDGTNFKPVMADAALFSQAIENLLSNALKFTEAGGKVTVRVENDLSDGLLRLTVKDTGIGITTDKLESVFDKYTQADSGRQRRYSGTGLGLAIVKQIINAHNGHISANSAPGEGSLFVIEIPLAYWKR